MMNKHRLIDIAEYISILAVLTGSTIAVISNQIIYATVPMALTILLNLIRRYQLEKQLHQQVSRDDKETYQQILNGIQSLSVSVVNYQNNYEAVKNEITALSKKFESVKTKAQGELNNESIHQLQTQCQNLQDTLNSLIYRMLSDGNLSSYEPKQAEEGIANIIKQYQNYKQEYKKTYSTILTEDLESHELEDY